MMELPRESDQPNGTDGENPASTSSNTGPSTGPGQESITAERLRKVIRNLETGFYDTPGVREHIARRVREEPAP
jgi:hypothetical protein